jgi:Protein of unknown function (DUF2723)
LDCGGLIGLATLVLYVWIAPTHVVDGDNAEFATLGATGGIAHPSGYPLYLLWLHATSWLPAASPAHAAAIATAVLGAASVVVLHAACRAWGARPLAATIAVAIFAAGPVVLRIETEAEVFALNCLVVAAVIWLAALDGPLRGWRRAAALGLVAGLGLSNHLTCVLIAPIGILGVIRAAREATLKPAVIGLAIAGLLVGLLPYGYAFVAADTPLSWGHVHNLGELVALFTRRDYGGPGAFEARGIDVSAGTSIFTLTATLARTWLWAPLLLGGATLVYRLVRSSSGETRWGWAMLATSFVLAGPVLASRFNVAPEGLGLYVCQRFHVLPAMLMAIPIAVGLSGLAKLIPPTRISERTWIAIAATVGFAAVAGTSLPHILRVHTPAVEDSARNMLRSLPPNAVVIESQDDLHSGAGYVQWVLGERQDVVLVTWSMMSMQWYRDRVSRRGIVAPAGDEPPLVRLADFLLASGKSLYVDRSQTAILAAFPTYPFGILIRVLPRGEKPPSVGEVFELNQAIYAKFELDYPRPGPDDEYPTEVHRRYAATWTVLAQALRASGKDDDAEWALEAAREIGPHP